MTRFSNSVRRRCGAGRHRSGLSWIEVLIGVAATGLLVSLCWPLILSAREWARRSSCQGNLRELGVGLHEYYGVHSTLPPAAVWGSDELQSLAIHRSRRFDLYTRANWAQLLLPFIDESPLAAKFDTDQLVSADVNAGGRTTSLDLMNCPSDTFNRDNNLFLFEPTEAVSITFARGNYAINGGSHCFDHGPGSTAFLTGDAAHLVMDYETRETAYWGNGVAGFNRAFSFDDCRNGLATLVGLEEVRAGVDPLDPRGVWALGQIGGSVTWAHGVNSDAYGPNNQHSRSDDILNCGVLHDLYGADQLREHGLPCVHYVDLNFQATARSRHPQGVNALFLDQVVRFLAEGIDPGLWHVLHSRETPPGVLGNDVEEDLERFDSIGERPRAFSHDRILTDKMPAKFENSLGMRFVRVPAGQFEMGLPDRGNAHDLPPEAPQHTVRISQPFYLAACEVTNREFFEVVQPDQSAGEAQAASADHPVTNVTWDQAHQFCEQLSSLADEEAAGRRYRLPTEAEWEYACRGGDAKPYKWRSKRRDGDESGDAAGILPPLSVRAVGSFAPNAFGLYDMRGNVWEWTADWFDRNYYSRSPEVDPQGPEQGHIKVIRGSSWTFVGEGCKISYPMMPPWKANPFVGFRVVCELVHPERSQ